MRSNSQLEVVKDLSLCDMMYVCIGTRSERPLASQSLSRGNLVIFAWEACCQFSISSLVSSLQR